MKKLVRESINEEQDYGDNNPRLHRDSKYDWPDTGEENEIETPDTSPAGEPYQMGEDIDPQWYEAFMEALHDEFPNEDDENLYMLLDILDTVEDRVQPKALFDLGHSPEQAADLIANSEEALDMWKDAISDGQENDNDDEDEVPTHLKIGKGLENDPNF